MMGQPLQSPRCSRIHDLEGVFERSRRNQQSCDVAVSSSTASNSEGPTFCMPCSRVSSDEVALGLVSGGEGGFGVWGRRAGSGEIWRRWSLVWSWFGPVELALGWSLGLDASPRMKKPAPTGRRRRVDDRYAAEACIPGADQGEYSCTHLPSSDRGGVLQARA